MSARPARPPPGRPPPAWRRQAAVPARPPANVRRRACPELGEPPAARPRHAAALTFEGHAGCSSASSHAWRRADERPLWRPLPGGRCAAWPWLTFVIDWGERRRSVSLVVCSSRKGQQHFEWLVAASGCFREQGACCSACVATWGFDGLCLLHGRCDKRGAVGYLSVCALLVEQEYF